MMSSDGLAIGGRREFLALGPALVLWPVARHPAQDEPAWPAVAVGYWLDSLEASDRVVVPDRSLPLDAELHGQSVRLGVRGHVPATPGGGLRSLDLWAHFRVLDAERSFVAPAHVWRFQAGSVPHLSSPVSFRAPVDPDWGVVFSVSRAADYRSGLLGRVATALGVRSGPTATRCRFTLEGGADSYRLRRGVYFIAGPRHSTGQLPRWSDYRYAPPEGATGRELCRTGVSGRQPVDFEYLTIFVRPEIAATPMGSLSSVRA